MLLPRHSGVTDLETAHRCRSATATPQRASASATMPAASASAMGNVRGVLQPEHFPPAMVIAYSPEKARDPAPEGDCTESSSGPEADRAGGQVTHAQPPASNSTASSSPLESGAFTPTCDRFSAHRGRGRKLVSSG